MQILISCLISPPECKFKDGNFFILLSTTVFYVLCLEYYKYVIKICWKRLHELINSCACEILIITLKSFYKTKFWW